MDPWLANRRIQPERYATFPQNFFKKAIDKIE
jgi:hypothetical protein